jgi:hypothetical protein
LIYRHLNVYQPHHQLPLEKSQPPMEKSQPPMEKSQPPMEKSLERTAPMKMRQKIATTNYSLIVYSGSRKRLAWV